MSRGTVAGVRRPLVFRPSFGVWAVAWAMLVAAVLGLAGLDHQLFWDDEANTAIYARNLLRFGRLTAWDGTNLVGYAYGGALGEDLGKELRVPGLPACVAALGMLVCGETTFGGRVMFVVAGVLSVGLLAVWMRRFLGRRFPWYLPALVLALSPAYLLYIRNCRYYALGVTWTLLLWIVWTPGSSRGRWPGRWWFDRRELCRYAAGAAVVLLLLNTHYVNAAAALVSLPVFLLERRYRQPRQYRLLGVLFAVAVLYGVWLWLTSNPFAADYETPPTSPLEMQLFERFYRNFGMYLRDLGTHEFVPWCLVPALLIPWLAPWTRRLRPTARRGWILVAVVVVYACLAGLLTPSDLGEATRANMRFVVPLIAVGSATGALAVVLLWRLARPLAVVALAVLVATNLLHLGFLASRVDRTSPSWPPTLYRYVAEIFQDYETGNEAMIRLLRQLPDGTTVRIWPPYTVYPPMFYVPKLRYCDQLKESKPIRADLRKGLPGYLFKERSRAEVILVPVPAVCQTLGELCFRNGRDSHELKSVLAPYFDYTSKPEIPAHFFSPPPTAGQELENMAVLVRKGTPIADRAALATDPTDADAVCRLGVALLRAGQHEAARRHLLTALRLNPDQPRAHAELGHLLVERGQDAAGIKHLRAALRLHPEYFAVHVDLGTALLGLGRTRQAREHYLAALRIRPNEAMLHFNLGNVALREAGGLASAAERWQRTRALDRAIDHYQQAFRLDPQRAPALVNWGIALFLQGKIEESIGRYRAALQRNPQMVPARVQLGISLYALGEKEAAITEVRRALTLVPPDSKLADQIRAKLREFGGP